MYFMFSGTKDSEFKKNVHKVLKNKGVLEFLRNHEKGKNLFDARRPISYEILNRIARQQFVCGNNAWGYNSYRISKYFYNKFFKENNSKNFEQNILRLINQSKNKTPQFSKNIKLPFKQISREPHEHALPGKEIIYSNKNNFSGYIGRVKDSGPYNYNYCNKTDIPFFKGPSNEAKQIIKNGYKELFSLSFVYGYITSFANLIFRWGYLDESDFEETKPDFIFQEESIKNQEKIKKLKIKLFKKIFKINEKETIKIINEIEKSIFESTLSNFLLAKEENYYTYTQYDENTSETMEEIKYEGTLDFIDDLKNKKENKYNKGYKNERINRIFNKTREDKYEVNIFENYGGILNFELFRFFTLRCFGLEPYDAKKLNLNDRDLFIRYGVNMGSQEINYYVVGKIFGGF